MGWCAGFVDSHSVMAELMARRSHRLTPAARLLALGQLLASFRCRSRSRCSASGVSCRLPSSAGDSGVCPEAEANEDDDEGDSCAQGLENSPLLSGQASACRSHSRRRTTPWVSST